MKKIVIRAVVLVLIFATILIVGILIAVNKEQKKNKYAQMTEHTIPSVTVAATAESGVGADISLTGFTDDVNPSYISGSVLPIGEDGCVDITISCADDGKSSTDVLAGVSYSIRKVGNEELLEDTRVTEGWSKVKKDNTITLKLTSLLEENTEYYLILKLATKRFAKVTYCTRIYRTDTGALSGMVDFANNISEATFDDEKAKEVLPIYIQADSSMANDDYGFVTLHSSYRMLTWGDLDATITKPKKLTFSQIGQDQTSLCLAYRVTLADDEGENAGREYLIRENYCIRWRNERYYLLDFTRTMDRLFKEETDVSDKLIRLGITSAESFVLKSSDNGNCTVFEQGNVLYEYRYSDNKLVRIFDSHGENGEDDYREANSGHEIKVVSLDDDGTMYFLINGYMYSGDHEGENGICFMKYTAAENAVEELFFAEAAVPKDILEKTTEASVFVTQSNMCYLMYGRNIYAIVLDGDEFYKVTDLLYGENSALSDDSNYVAWENLNDDGKYTYGNSISMMNLITGKSNTLSVEDTLSQLGLPSEKDAEDEYFLHVLGYIDNDLVYGIGRVSDIHKDAVQEEVLPLFALNIVDGETYEAVGKYCKDNSYVVSGIKEGTRITMGRETRTGGNWAKMSDDILILNQSVSGDMSAPYSAAIKTTSNLNRLKEYRIVITTSASRDKVEHEDGSETEAEFGIVNAEYRKQSGKDVRVLSVETPDPLNFNGIPMMRVYARGKLQYVTSSITDAIAEAKAKSGLVRDPAGNIVWELAPKKEKSVLDVPAANEFVATGDAGMILYGTPVSEINYYLNNGQYVFADISDTETMCIYGYDANHYYMVRATRSVTGGDEEGNGTVSYEIKGEPESMTSGDAKGFFEKKDNLFYLAK